MQVSIGAGLGNWITEILVKLLDDRNCKCCQPGRFEIIENIGEYVGEKPLIGRAPVCYTDGTDVWAEATRVPTNVGDGFFATVYKVTLKKADKLMIKCD